MNVQADYFSLREKKNNQKKILEFDKLKDLFFINLFTKERHRLALYTKRENLSANYSTNKVLMNLLGTFLYQILVVCTL